MRQRVIAIAIILLCGLALFDVFTAWEVIPLVAAVACLAAGVVVAVIGARKLRLVFLSLVTICFMLHVGFAMVERYERARWDDLQRVKAEEALVRARTVLDAVFAQVSAKADEISGVGRLAESLRNGNRREAFTTLSTADASRKWRSDAHGIAVTDRDGNVFAWAGKLPDYVGDRSARGTYPSISVRRSTTGYWIEGRWPIGQAEESLGGVIVFRQLDAIYPGLLPRATTSTLSEDLTSAVGHEVTVAIGKMSEADSLWHHRGRITGSITLPDGTPVGELVIRARTFAEESGILRSRGMFLASIAALVLIVLGCALIGWRLMGLRFGQASTANLALLLVAIGGARFAFSLLRGFLNLDTSEPFTSVHYATQMPTGILRSPADLAITGAVVCVGAALVLLAKAYRPRAIGSTPKRRSHDALPVMLLAFVVGAIASTLIVLSGYVYEKLFADSAVVLLTLSPFDLSSSHIVLRIGFFTVSTGLVLLGGTLIQWQIALLRQAGFGWSRIAHLPLPAVLTVYLIVTVFVVAGASPFVFITATVCFGFGLLLDAVYRRRVTVGTVSIVMGFALAVAMLQAPYAVRDHEAKRRESIQAISQQIEAQSDAWKISVLEGAVAEIADRGGLAEVLAGARAGLDDFALGLWANSILSRADVISGIYMLGSDHEVMGRFSLEDMGDMPDVEGAIRNAKFSGKPVTVLTRGGFAGSDIDLYVGVIPVFDGEVYLGSIVISIPFAYGDLRSMAGLRSSFLEAFALGDTYGDPLEGGYSASLLSDRRIVSTTAKDFEVGRSIAALDGVNLAEPGWIEHKVAGTTYASYYIPPGERSESLLLSLRLPSASDRVVHVMGLLIGDLLIALFIIMVVGLTGGLRHAVRASRGRAPSRLRWSFASKLAIAFVLIAIVPTLILGTTSRRFLRARLRETMESKAEEGLNLSKLALERLLGSEAVRLARNPILIDELTEEPSILGMLISHDVSSAVFNSSGAPLATYGDPQVPPAVLGSVLREGRSYNFFSVEDGLYAKSAVPVRDVISPGRVRGCAFVSRRIDDALAHQLSGELGRDISFFGSSTVAASSKREVFVSELMSTKISPDAYLECFVSGRELHFTWERIGGIDLVIGFSPLRGFDGATVGAISIPVLFRKDDVGRRMEWTSTAISYLLVIVIGSIFILGLVLARRISRPIRDLIRGTLRIGSGDLRFTIPKSGDDEIGDLVSSFNKMTGALSKSRKALSERKHYIETIIGNVGAGIISTDWRGRIDTFNGAAEKLLSIKGRNARGRDAGNLLRKIGASSLAAVLDEVQGEQSLTRKEVSLTQANGRPMTLRAVASNIRGSRGRGMGKVIVFEDVTELIRSKQLIAWSEMARQVAHEIKNPLTPMKLSAQQLLQSHRDRADDFDRVLEGSVATIIEQIESLRRIAVEFSQFSRMPERKIEITDLNRILEECLAQYERTIGATIEITKQMDTSLPRLKLDRDEIKRVFLNVIENAIQAMPDGGSLKVRSGRQRGRSGKTGYRLSVSSRDAYADPLRDCVEVGFTDTGIGIAAGDSKRLFEPNFSTKTHGSGLGLAICKGIVDGYGGEIVIESTPGVGTCVRIRLPVPERSIRRDRPRRRGSGRSHRPRSR